MSNLAFFASPVDFDKNNNNNNLQENKKKIDLDVLKKLTQSSNTSSKEETEISNIHSNIHNELKDENEAILGDFYSKEMQEDLKKQVSNKKFNQDSYKGENIKTDYLISNNIDANRVNFQQQSYNIPNQNELLQKLNYIIELFEEQKEIKTNQKNEEVVLYCFLGIFVIYVLDSFVYIGKYKR